jgi:hypothetical protein
LLQHGLHRGFLYFDRSSLPNTWAPTTKRMRHCRKDDREPPVRSLLQCAGNVTYVLAIGRCGHGRSARPVPLQGRALLGDGRTRWSARNCLATNTRGDPNSCISRILCFERRADNYILINRSCRPGDGVRARARRGARRVADRSDGNAATTSTRSPPETCRPE